MRLSDIVRKCISQAEQKLSFCSSEHVSDIAYITLQDVLPDPDRSNLKFYSELYFNEHEIQEETHSYLYRQGIEDIDEVKLRTDLFISAVYNALLSCLPWRIIMGLWRSRDIKITIIFKDGNVLYRL